MSLRFAIMGAGAIAREMADTVARTDIMIPYAVASREEVVTTLPRRYITT